MVLVYRRTKDSRGDTGGGGSCGVFVHHGIPLEVIFQAAASVTSTSAGHHFETTELKLRVVVCVFDHGLWYNEIKINEIIFFHSLLP